MEVLISSKGIINDTMLTNLQLVTFSNLLFFAIATGLGKWIQDMELLSGMKMVMVGLNQGIRWSKGFCQWENRPPTNSSEPLRLKLK